LPTTLSLVNATFQGRERGIAFAVWGSTIGGMVAVGPVLGGWLATDFTWRWAFLINVPLGAVIIVGLLLFVLESRAPGQVKGVDVIGALLSILLFGPLVFGLIEGRIYGWWNASDKNIFSLGDWAWPEGGLSVIPVALAISLLAGVGFVLWERSREKRGLGVLLDLNLFKIASFRNWLYCGIDYFDGRIWIAFCHTALASKRFGVDTDCFWARLVVPGRGSVHGLGSWRST